MARPRNIAVGEYAERPQVHLGTPENALNAAHAVLASARTLGDAASLRTAIETAEAFTRPFAGQGAASAAF